MKKQNKRNQFTRMALALLLILSMLGNTLIFPTVAQETVAPVDDTTSSETPSADEATTDAISTPTLPEPILLTAADIPEFISAAALSERGAVERMRSEETNMSSVIFRNSDGTRTMYMYGLPVKYTAADGTVRDKSTNLVSVSTASVLLTDQPVAQTMAQMSLAQQEALQAELGILDVERAADTLHMLSTALTARQRSLSDMAYTTLDNDVYALFPTNLAKGMTLVFGEHSVRMTPAGTGMTVSAGGNVTKTTTSSLTDADVAERLLYPNVFGLGTAVQYTPTLTGVKEEILLSRNVGKNSFAFLLETGGLVLAEQSGQFVLIDPETEQQVGKLGEITVFDSAGQVVRGNMTAQTILAGQKYGITISVDQEFLASATYPVSIDPTTYINPFNQVDTNLIEDVAVYNHEDAWNYTFEDYHYLGTVPYTSGSTYIGYALYRFPAFYDSSIQFGRESVDLSCLLSFKLHLKSITPNATASTFNLYTAPYQADWDDNARICSFQASCYCDNSSSLCSNVSSVPAQGTFEVDLTEYLEYWINVRDGNITTTSTADFETGVAIGLANSGTLWLEPITDNTHTYATCEYSIVPLDTPVYLNSAYTRTFLGRDAENNLIMMSGLVGDIGDQITWEFEYVGNDQYAIHPQGMPEMCMNSFANIEVVSGSLDESCRWTLSPLYDMGLRVCNVETGEYLVVEGVENSVVYTSTTASLIGQRLWRIVSAAEYSDVGAEMNSTSESIWIAPDEQLNVLDYIDFENLYFDELEDFSYDVADIFAVTEMGGIITGFLGNRSTLLTVTHKPTGLSSTMTIEVTPFAEGVYYFSNGKTGDFMQIAAGDASEYDTEGAAIEIRDFDSGDHQRWTIRRVDRNYYSIVSKKSEKALTVQTEDVNADGNALAQETAQECNRQLWSFEKTSNGTYIIRPRSANDYTTDWCMSKSDSLLSGWNVVQTEYDEDENYADEWRIYNALTYVRLTLPVRIYYDVDTSILLSKAQIESEFNSAVEIFLSRYNILFDLQSITYSSELDCSSTCVASTANDICVVDGDSNCGSAALCSLNHHRSAQRLLDVLTSQECYTYRLVGYALCWYDIGGHRAVIGGGNLNGKNAVTSVLTTSNLQQSIQHELTHNLGGAHATCDGASQACVLSGDIGKWCDTCADAIKRNYY